MGLGDALRRLRRPSRVAEIPGLRQADVAAAIPLSGSPVPSIGLRRVGLVAFWDDRNAADAFLATDSLAASFAGGWHATLEPLRAFGAWPGLPDTIPRSRHTDYDGPAVVVTLGRLRLPQVIRFLRTSRPAAAAALTSGGMRWGTALVRPPLVATCSLWESTAALSDYAYGTEGGLRPRSGVTAD
ncbi:MAG: hypothetical protein ACRD0G_08070 [Acidimicrobiales bacterium]